MAGNYTAVVTQGDTFRLNFTVATDGVPWNFTGYTARMEVRQSPGAATTIMSADTASGITMDSLGSVSITIPASATNVTPSKYSYDFEVTSSGGEVTTLLSGKFIVEASVTN